MYWKTLEELAQTKDFKESLKSEFLLSPEETKGVEQSEWSSGVSRREFLRLMGASLAMASAVACSRRPVEKIVPYLNKPEEITPGVATWYASTCGACPAACGLLTKNREGRPIKLEGNPDHPLSQGGLCARGQASLLDLYDPDRLKQPLRKISNGNKTEWEKISWEIVDEHVQKIFSQIQGTKGSVRLLTGEISSPSTKILIQQFCNQLNNAKQIVFEPLNLDALRKANSDCYGEDVVPHYLFEKADLILSFGADFLGTWLSPVEATKNFSKKRKLNDGTFSRFICFEPTPSVTGTNADLHIPVHPLDCVKVALSLAHEIVVTRKLSSFAGSMEIETWLSPFDVESVGGQTQMDPQILRKTAKELWEKRGRSLVLGGNYSLSGEEGHALQIAVNFLNTLLQNDGVTVDTKHSPSLQSESRLQFLQELIQEMEKGKVDCLMIVGTNPVYTLPKSFRFEEALKRVPVVIDLSTKLDETAQVAHWVLPLPHFLESWGDAEPQKGLFSLFQPAITNLYAARQFQDSLLKWSGNETSWYNYLKAYWEEKIFPRYGGFSFVNFWESALRKGVVDLRVKEEVHPPRNFSTFALKKAIEMQRAKEGPTLALYATVSHYDGRNGNNGWLMELPDPLTKVTWNSYVALSPQTAMEMNIGEGDVLELKTKDFEGEFAVHFLPGLAQNVLAVPLGFGHTHIGRVGDKVGVNAFQYLTGEGSFTSSVQISKTGKWVKLASTQGHQNMMGRPIVKETTLKEYQENPRAGNEEMEHHPSIWSSHKYEGYRWGMAIDLNACTGCSACMVACQAENNIPVVGEERVKKGREMHWIRIDRYYEGETKNPKVVHQPMLCQHCENAPCETVCPVLATTHNEEGLNVQTYNRCVGTRYCSNNCPYKVRRFNWFEYLWKEQPPLAMVLNPDVTVREKGVMEKCTFCVQRIQEGKDHAKDFGRKVEDGEVQTACQQSCPANAIVFGNLNDPESRVSKLTKDPRGYHVLSELNTKPAVTYLTKVRNEG